MNWKNQCFKEISKFIPTTTTRITRNKYAPWFSHRIRYLIRQKIILYKIAIHSKRAKNWRTYCAARNRAMNAIKMTSTYIPEAKLRFSQSRLP